MAGLLAFLGATACSALPREPERAAGDPAAALGQPMEGFVLPAAGGGTVRFDPRSGELASVATFVHALQPDCLACQEQARALQELAEDVDGAAVVAVAHRGSAEDTDVFVRSMDVSFPVAVGAGSPWAARWGTGDPLYVVDQEGRVRYAQVGFSPADGERWRSVVADLAAGRAPVFTGPDREPLLEGHPFPVLELPDMDGRTLSLRPGEDSLLLAREGEVIRRYRAAIGFFSRY